MEMWGTEWESEAYCIRREKGNFQVGIRGRIWKKQNGLSIENRGGGGISRTSRIRCVCCFGVTIASFRIVLAFLVVILRFQFTLRKFATLFLHFGMISSINCFGKDDGPGGKAARGDRRWDRDRGRIQKYSSLEAKRTTPRWLSLPLGLFHFAPNRTRCRTIFWPWIFSSQSSRFAVAYLNRKCRRMHARRQTTYTLRSRS